MEEKKKANKKIKCDVESCEHNDSSCNCCDLDNINVSCNCDPTCACKSETICDSFKEKNS